jgi:hypothetical protein
MILNYLNNSFEKLGRTLTCILVKVVINGRCLKKIYDIICIRHT